MSILSRIRIIPQERFDLEDLTASQSASRTDAKFWTKQFLSNENYILKGFTVAGLGLKEATLDTTNGTLINAANTSDFSWFVIDPATTSITISDAELDDGQRNYVELELCVESNTPVTKAFWDPAAAGGLGAEFNQEIDTIEDLAVKVVVQTGGFSGDPNRLPVAIIDTDLSGNITGIRDKRDLFFRLGTGSNPSEEFTFVTRQEPEITLSISGVVGTFTEGEEVTFTSGASATVSQGGTASIKVRLPSNDSFLAGDTVTGVDSGATGILVDYLESFTGADKDIDDFKEALNALMTEVKNIKGTDFWYQDASVSMTQAFEILGLSVLVGANSSAKFAWSGTELSITDDSGTPLATDVIAYIRSFTHSDDLAMTRQDATDSPIAIGDGQVLYVTLPETGSRTYDGIGALPTNFVVADRGDLSIDDRLYWLAYREGSKVYLRGLGELEAGEERQVNDETPEALQQFLGFNPETASSVPYSELPDGTILDHTYTTSSSLVEAISTNTANINDLGEVLKAPVYDESYEVVAATPSGNELLGPVAVGTILSLPLNSRDGNSVQEYMVGDGIIELYLNGQYWNPGPNTFSEVGAVGTPSSQIQLNRELEVGDTLIFRIDTAGGYKVIGGPVSSGSLQTSYNNGRQIVVASGQPVEISGPASQKLFRVLGDIEVTGVIDPQGLTFTRESSNPITGFDGLYVDSNGDLVYNKNGSGETNISQSTSGQGASIIIEDEYDNNSGMTIAKGTPVRIDAFGNLQMVDPAVEDEVDAIIGVTAESIPDASAGRVSFKGRLLDVSTAIAVGEPAYLSKSGILTATKPSDGIGGFVAGDFIVRVGTIVMNRQDPLKKDLLVDIKVIGEL